MAWSPLKTNVVAFSDVRDEAETLAMMIATLNTSLIYYVKGIADTGLSSFNISSNDDRLQGEVVSAAEATSFIALIVEIVSSRPEALQQLVFDAPYDMFETLGNIIAATKRYTPPPKLGERPLTALEAQDAFVALRVEAIKCVKGLVTLIADVAGGAHAAASETHQQQQLQRAHGSHLMKLCSSAILRASLADTLIAILTTPTAPLTVRVASVETLFVITMKIGVELIPIRIVDDLLSLAHVEPDDAVRRYSVATLREVAELSPTALATGAKTLLRLAAVDNDPDVRTLSIDAVGCYLRHVQSAEAQQRGRQRSISNTSDPQRESDKALVVSVAEVLTLRLESPAESDDVLEASCRTFETCLQLACLFRDETVFRFAAQHGTHNHLLRCLDRSHTIGAISAKTLRVLVERAPPHLSVASRLVTSSSLATILKCVMEQSSGELHNESISTRILCVELATLIGIVLAFSPANRLKFAHELHAFPMWAQTVASRLQECFACAAVDYFEDMVLLDESGRQLNDPDAVEWSPVADDHQSHQQHQPTQLSLRTLFETQELHRRNPAGLNAWIECENIRHGSTHTAAKSSSDPRRGYLAMVILGYACLSTIARAQRTTTNTASIAATAAAVGAAAAAPSSSAGTPRGVRIGGAAMDEIGSPPMTRVANPALHESLANFFIRDASPRMSAAAQQQPPPGVSASAPRPQKMFPTAPPGVFAPATPRPGAQQQVQQPTAAADNAVHLDGGSFGLLRAEFEACMKLAIEFSELYINKRRGAPVGTTVAGTRAGEYAKTAHGLIMRASRVPKLQNPFAAVQVDKNHLRAWSVQCVEEGDLLFFSIPLAALTASVIENVIAKARRHATMIKKAFITTPQTKRERRWFLQDMQSAIMPRIITYLKNLQKILQSNGEQHVQLALSVLPAMKDATGEKVLYSGNLPTVVQFLQQHYTKSMPAGYGSTQNLQQTRSFHQQQPQQHHHDPTGFRNTLSFAPSDADDGGAAATNASFRLGLGNASFGSAAHQPTHSFGAGGGLFGSSPQRGAAAALYQPFNDVMVSPRSDVTSGSDDLEDRY